jgi:Transglutaminase-like superfamily
MSDVAVPPSSDSRSPLSVAPEGSKTSSIAAIAIAGVGAAVMIDLAVETFIGESALRWWAVAAAAVYLALTVAARRRNIGWSSQLTIVLVFALGLAAATAWLPAGLANGIRLAGQPTSRVLSGLTAGALVVAIVIVLRATILPLAVRLVISLLALYGLAAFFLGAWQTTPYQALFAGDSMWRALPRWLQGGVIGGLLALPLALLVALAGGLTRGKRNWSAQTIVMLVSALALAFAALRNGQAGGIGASDEAREAQAQPDQRTLADASTLIKRIADAPEPSTFSVDKTADEIGNNPASLFTYVHEHVRTEIYSGLLRGARGTLMGGAGNSWDQALLLAAMLRHQGREVRFAHAHLTSDIAAKIVDRMFTDMGKVPVTARRPLTIPDSVQAGGRATMAQIQRDWQSAQADLLKALDRADLSLGNAATSEQTLESEAADHLFVEYHDGDRWVPLDPVATVAPGASVASDGESFPEVPDAFYHHVTIRVQIEERHDQKLQQKEVLRFPTTAAALNGEQVLLSHRFDHDIAGRWRATPVLRVGGHSYAARTFSDAGLAAGKANSKEDLISQAHQTVGQLGQVTDLFGNSKAPAPAAASESGLTAESLEVEFIDPANHSETVRREMIDRIGPVARANKTAESAPLTPITVANDIPLELAGIYALAFASGPLSPALPIRRLSSIDGLFEDLQALANAPPAQKASLSSEDRDRLTRVIDKYPALLQASAESTLVMSQRLAQPLRIGDASTLFYEATPRLVIASFDLTTGLALDLRRNTVRAVGRKSSGSELVRANLARSVADAAIEGTLLMPKSQPRRIAAIDIFYRARTEGIRLVAVRGGAPLTTVQASDLARARMANAVPGRLLIAPERTPSAAPSHFAWWQLDPSTGEAISVLDSGLNGFIQELPEEAETLEISSMAYEVAAPSNSVISPMAYEVAAPRAQCVFWTNEMLLELIRVLGALGG